MSPFFKDNNVHKFPTHQPPLKTSGPPFSATSAPFLRFLSSPLAPWSAQNGENPRVCFPFPEPTHPLSEPDKTHPVTTYRFLAFRKKKGGNRIHCRYSGPRRGRVFKTVSRNLRHTDDHGSPSFPLTETVAASVLNKEISLLCSGRLVTSKSAEFFTSFYCTIFQTVCWRK